MKTILPGQTIGIIGGGQLGRMMGIAAKEMGYRVAVLDPKENSPTGQIADIEIVASYDDLEAAKQLAGVSDVITYEFENIDYNVLQWLEDNAYLPQGGGIIQTTQDRANEKAAIVKSGAQVAPYELVDTKERLHHSLDAIGLPAVLKTRTGGYDGKGQVMIKTEEDIEEAAQLLTKGRCILEKFLPFEKEISVIVNRSVSGETKVFPVGENIHVDHILMETIVPARVNESVAEKATTLAREIASSLSMIGTLGVEMFLLPDGEIYINELAPRPHNSGHYTMNACETSQFHQHVRAICNWPLSPTKLFSPIIMMNVLGEHFERVINKVPQMDRPKLHLYGKDGVKEKRKMGHVNFVGESIEEIKREIDALSIWA
ncbi:5-(carboxyamino)imidazole ribonucleotide synthase [Salirhabdus salicampi]|uniref:5-(carboxyamino)imidazole ribonucleotide synthase n=1 Tax=Salirhabdus salicampi TaxID=476102 RepID=UPI0020C4E8CA|nr:5-(carboxyamino)imidazole ribonucleotide synthase [Salirhabdus salicampi]MCP8618011.1 5-(carboxyamino)imidazole ribonucleotide synthase [Salirhabdus salicampi]